MTSTIYSRERHHNSATVVITAARLARCIGAGAGIDLVRKSPIERLHRARLRVQPRIANREDPRYREDATLSLKRARARVSDNCRDS